jgi:two-component system heavy metal sensor histidine kinase CusS
MSSGSDAKPQHSLATRLSAAYFGMSFLLIVITNCLLYWAAVSALRWADDQVLMKRMLTLRDLLQDQVSPDFLVHEVTEDLEGPRRVFMRIVADSEELHVQTAGAPDGLESKDFPDMSAAPLDTPLTGTLYAKDGEEFRFSTMRIPLSPYWHAPSAVLQVSSDTTLDKQILGWFRLALVAVILSAAVVCWVIARYLVNRELRPLRAITSAASKIGRETLDYRLPLRLLPAELHELACQFNDMLSRLEIAYVGLRQYADNIAHELRGPLNRMLLACEVGLLKSRTAEEYRESLLSNVEECDRLSSITQSLLFLARADNAQATIQRQQVDLVRELEIVRDYFEVIADEAGLTLEIVCKSDIKFNVDRPLFQRALGNLVVNAITHTSRGGSVKLRAANDNGSVAIEVSDSGKGISPEHLPHVFDRFYRVDQVRSPEDGCLGLGLAITKSIVELHQGSIILTSELGKGTSVTMIFPNGGAH